MNRLANTCRHPLAFRGDSSHLRTLNDFFLKAEWPGCLHHFHRVKHCLVGGLFRRSLCQQVIARQLMGESQFCRSGRPWITMRQFGACSGALRVCSSLLLAKHCTCSLPQCKCGICGQTERLAHSLLSSSGREMCKHGLGHTAGSRMAVVMRYCVLVQTWTGRGWNYAMLGRVRRVVVQSEKSIRSFLQALFQGLHMPAQMNKHDLSHRLHEYP